MANRHFIFVALIFVVGLWLLYHLFLSQLVVEYRRKLVQEHNFNAPMENYVRKPEMEIIRQSNDMCIPKTETARSRINAIDAANVERFLHDVRCAPLKTAKGKPICFDTKDKFIGQEIANHGAWEGHIWEAMLRLLNKDPELGLIDIGANIGVFTISASAMGRSVIAVEAFYENIQRLSESLRTGGLSDKVTIVYNAVSDVYEEVYFWRPEDNPGGTHTLSKGATIAPEKPVFAGEHNKVNTIHMDDLLLITPFEKAIMKIDIEGYENKAFKNVGLLLDCIDIQAVFMEWTFAKASDDYLNTMMVLTSRNYRAHTPNFEPLSGTTREEMGQWTNDIIWLKAQRPIKRSLDGSPSKLI